MIKQLHEHLLNVLYREFAGEINDQITRGVVQDVLMKETRYLLSPIYGIMVCCDELNNPPSVVDSYQLVADVYITGCPPSIIPIHLHLKLEPTSMTFPREEWLFEEDTNG